MPAAKKTTDAEAAAVEANADVDTTEVPDPPEGMIVVPFRGVDLTVPGPEKWGRSFRLRMAAASGDMARLLAGLIGPVGTAQVAALVNEDEDDFEDVAAEFFRAYNEVTGAGNS